MDVGISSNLEIKPTTELNNDKIIKGMKPIGSQCESKVKTIATKTKLVYKSTVSNCSSTPISTSSFARHMIVPSPLFILVMFGLLTQVPGVLGGEILTPHPKVKIVLKKSTFARIFHE